jgi:hypothetical protein
MKILEGVVILKNNRVSASSWSGGNVATASPRSSNISASKPHWIGTVGDMVFVLSVRFCIVNNGEVVK